MITESKVFIKLAYAQLLRNDDTFAALATKTFVGQNFSVRPPSEHSWTKHLRFKEKLRNAQIFCDAVLVVIIRVYSY